MDALDIPGVEDVLTDMLAAYKFKLTGKLKLATYPTPAVDDEIDFHHEFIRKMDEIIQDTPRTVQLAEYSLNEFHADIRKERKILKLAIVKIDLDQYEEAIDLIKQCDYHDYSYHSVLGYYYRKCKKKIYGTTASQEQIDDFKGECSICCDDDFKNPIILECRHMFCERCIDEWVSKYPTCPCCRHHVSKMNDKLAFDYLQLAYNEKPLDSILAHIAHYHEKNDFDLAIYYYTQITSQNAQKRLEILTLRFPDKVTAAYKSVYFIEPVTEPEPEPEIASWFQDNRCGAPNRKTTCKNKVKNGGRCWRHR